VAVRAFVLRRRISSIVCAVVSRVRMSQHARRETARTDPERKGPFGRGHEPGGNERAQDKGEQQQAAGQRMRAVVETPSHCRNVFETGSSAARVSRHSLRADASPGWIQPR
jgi:hypothetical protein